VPGEEEMLDAEKPMTFSATGWKVSPTGKWVRSEIQRFGFAGGESWILERQRGLRMGSNGFVRWESDGATKARRKGGESQI
jgi:hypothetical protein